MAQTLPDFFFTQRKRPRQFGNRESAEEGPFDERARRRLHSSYGCRRRLAFPVLEGDVPRGSDQPSLDAPAVVDQRSVPDPDEQFLDDLGRDVAVARDAKRERVHTRCMRVVEGLGSGVDGHGVILQLPVAGGRWLEGAIRQPATGHRQPVYAPTMNWLLKNFLRGLVIVVPVVATVWVIVKAFTTIDALLAFRYPGAGVVVIVVGTLVVGVLASNFVGRRVVRLMDALFARAPIVRLVYSSLKDLLEAFVGDKKRFDKPVAVAITDDVTTLGFVTQDDLAFLEMVGKVAVYFPFSYSMAGVLLVVPASRVTPIAAESASVMALIVSGGVSRANT